MSTKIRIGIVGAGRIGSIHAENLAFRIPEAETVALADPDTKRAAQCADRLRIGSVYSDPRKLLDDDLDAIILCSPTDHHAQQIELFAQAGKHIFCEKPIDLSLERIDQVLSVIERSKIKFQLGFNRRFDPNFARARELIASGKIGTPEVVRITSRDPAPPPADYIQSSGGMFLDMTIHDFDMARWIISEEVTELHAFTANLVDPEIGKLGDIDTAIVSLKYASGAVGAIDNSRRAVYGYDQRVEILGSSGSVVVSNVPETTATLSTTAGVANEKPMHFFLQRYAEAYLAEMKAFIEAIRRDTAPPVNAIDGRIPVILALAAQASSKEGRAITIS